MGKHAIDGGNQGGQEVIDTTYDDEQYHRFYECLGKCYPESDIVYKTPRGVHRFNVILGELRPFAKEGKRLLDAGCGSGLYTIEYCKMGGKGHGIDLSKDLVREARSRLEGLHLEAVFKTMDLQRKIDWDEGFDVVLFTETLEHLNHPNVALENLTNALNENGHMIITTPTPLNHSLKLRWDYIKEVLVGKKVFELHKFQTMGSEIAKCGVPNFVYRHSGFYPKGLKRWIEGFGLECLYYYTIESHIPGMRKASRAIPSSALRNLHPLSLFGCRNVQVFLKTS